MGLLAVPVGAGIAILKYHLYDIDRIINRTLVYGVLTASLAAIYAVFILSAQTLVLGAGATGVPDVVIAGSTLAVAALFHPLRRRLQGFIDRHFYRRKYDAARTVEAFSSRLRDEVDLETMRLDLLKVVQETMQPRKVSLWLQTGR